MEVPPAAGFATDERHETSHVGDRPELGRLRTLADQLRVAGRLTFDGSLPRVEVARLLVASDVYVHTATAETSGVSIVEALLSGLPVVTTD